MEAETTLSEFGSSSWQYILHCVLLYLLPAAETVDTVDRACSGFCAGLVANVAASAPVSHGYIRTSNDHASCCVDYTLQRLNG